MAPPPPSNPPTPRLCRIASIQVGQGRPLAVIAGPCVLESLEQSLAIARHVQAACARLGLSFIFKGSFDKANRSSIKSARGPGMELGLEWLSVVRRELAVPITTDIHEPSQAAHVAKVVDLLQIPAFLCRQTDLLLAAGHAAAAHHRAVNVKKGQFMAPSEMSGVVRKLAEAGCDNTMLTERGTFFGYHRLVNDFVGVADLIEGLGEAETETAACGAGTGAGSPRKPLFAGAAAPPVCFDATHSTQRPGLGEITGGRPERARALACAAAAVGVHAIFLECHPHPERALSDRATVQPLDSVEPLLADCAAIHAAINRADPGIGLTQ